MRHDILIRYEMYIYDVINEKNSNPIMMSLHSSYKKFSSMRALVDVSGKTKYCVSCSNTATQEAIFTADGATIIEKYCDSCAKNNMT
jgi:MinD superfamily P-loop ATPase